MASPQALDKYLSNAKVQLWDHDPGATTALFTTPDGGTTDRFLDMKDYRGFVAAAMLTVPGTGGAITKLEIVAATDAAGANATVIKDSGTIAADAAGDWAILECSAEEIAQEAEDAGVALRYVAARITMSAADAEAAVMYIGIKPVRVYDGLTPGTTIA